MGKENLSREKKIRPGNQKKLKWFRHAGRKN